MGEAKKFKALVKEKQNLAGNFWCLRLEPEGKVPYQSGQYVSMRVNEKNERRSYSIASCAEEDSLDLLIDVTPMGEGSKFVLNLEEGDRVDLLGPIGGFVINEEEEAKGFLLIGTGSGIVPLRAMIYDLLKVKKEKRPIRLHWGMRYEKDLFWIDDFKELEREFPNFKVDIVLSKEENWDGCVGHVQDCLEKHRESWAGWETFLCGNKKMIEDVKNLLQKKGIKEESIHFEKFY